MALTFYLEFKKMGTSLSLFISCWRTFSAFLQGFKFDQVHFPFLQLMAFAAGISHAKGLPNALPVIPLDDLLRAQIIAVPQFHCHSPVASSLNSQGLDSGNVPKELVEDFSAYITRLLNRKLADFKPPAAKPMASTGSAPLLDDLNSAFLSKSNPHLITPSDPSPPSGEKETSTKEPSTPEADKGLKETEADKGKEKEKDKDKKDKGFFGTLFCKCAF